MGKWNAEPGIQKSSMSKYKVASIRDIHWLYEIDPDGILRLLDAIFSGIDPKEKIRVMEDDFGIPVAPVIEREVNNMGGFSDAFFARGVERGIDEGVSKSIRMLSDNKNISIVEAMNLIGIPKAEQQKYLDILEPKCV